MSSNVLPSSEEELFHPTVHGTQDSDAESQLDVESFVDEPPNETDSPIEPGIRVAFFIFGCALLLPWNELITATPYFLSRLSGSSYQSTFASYLSTSFTATSLLVFIYTTATSTQASPARRIYISSVILAFLTFLLAMTTFTHTSRTIFVSFVLTNSVLQATANAYLQPAVIALASLFGPTAIGATMSGQGAVGVLVSLVQVLSATASVSWGGSPVTPSAPNEDGAAEARSAFTFLALSTLFLISVVTIFAWLTGQPAYKAVIAPFEHRQRRARSLSASLTETEGLMSRGQPSDTKGQIMRVAKANITYEIAVTYVYIVTLSVFPAITTSIMSTGPAVHPLLFSAYHFLVFNIGDFVGRTIPMNPRFVTWSAKRILTLSLARTLFIPLFLMCNLQRATAGTVATPIISSDVVYMLLLFAFGSSSGYVSSVCIMSASSLEHNPRLKGRKEDVAVAATLAIFCLIAGLAFGSVSSFAVRSVVCDCNPFKQS